MRSVRSAGLGLTAVVAAATTLVFVGTAGSAPADDSFYAPPASLSGAHGSVIRSEPLTGVAALSDAGVNERVLYESVSAQGEPIAVSGIVALPTTPAPAGGYPVVSWTHGTLGSADKCAPSRDTADSPANPFNVAPQPMLNRLLRQGYAVVMTDYEGLGTPGSHPYLLGESEARGALDIVRAARRLHPEISDRLAIVGHSQGGQAALFAAHDAPTWTPELKLATVVALAPANHIALGFQASLLAPSANEAYAFHPLFINGAVAGDPSIDPRNFLTAQAYDLYVRDTENRCRVELSEPDSWGGLRGIDIVRLDAIGGVDYQKFIAQLQATEPALPISAPIRVVQGEDDQRVNPVGTGVLAGELRAVNGPGRVTYVTYPQAASDPLGAHFGLLTTDTEPLADWLQQHFDGR
ncbi:alpha/beta hydrolase family protein [Nocardia tengchongensis]